MDADDAGSGRAPDRSPPARGRGRRARQDADFTAYAAGAAPRLRRTAYLMCRDWHLADDLTQAALTKLYVAWPRVSRADDLDAYARKVLLNGLLDLKRRRSSSELPTGELPESAGGPPAASADRTALRLTLFDALATLAPLDRAIVVLRYWDDCSIEQTADVLRLTQQSVKQRSKRSLEKIRAVLADETFALLLN